MNLSFSQPQLLVLQLVSRVLILLIALPVHEMAHAFAAYRLGDMTSRDYGRLSLNPLDHLDPIGAFMILIGGFGWAKPVPVNPYGLSRSRNGTIGFAIVAASGPISNLFLAALFAVPVRLAILPAGFVENLVVQFVYINIALAVFNLIPIPPLDGSRIAVAVLPPHWGDYILRLEQYGIMIILGLFLVGNWLRFDVLGLLMNPPIYFLARLILG